MKGLGDEDDERGQGVGQDNVDHHPHDEGRGLGVVGSCGKRRSLILHFNYLILIHPLYISLITGRPIRDNAGMLRHDRRGQHRSRVDEIHPSVRTYIRLSRTSKNHGRLIYFTYFRRQ